MIARVAELADLARPDIRALKPYASARALADAAGILLNANENPFPPFGDDGRALNRYPDPQPASLRARLAALYNVSEDRLLITRGSDEGIDLLIRVFCRPGRDAVLINPPCFGMYALSARVQGAPVHEAPLIENQEEWTAPDDLAAQAAECRLAFLCSPNNPTGNRLPNETIAAVAGGMNGLTVVDEAYVEFMPEGSVLPMQLDLPNLVVLRTLSKAHALAGCRVGVVIAHPVIIDLLRRIIAPYPLPSPTVEAALTALSDEGLAAERAHLATLAEQKPRVVEALARHRAIEKVWPGHANFVLVRTRNGTALVEAARDAGLRLRDQSSQPQLRNCVRITIGAPEENGALLRFLQRWPQ